ncbi:unnamed protein product [Lampetra fluviatilis]
MLGSLLPRAPIGCVPPNVDDDVTSCQLIDTIVTTGSSYSCVCTLGRPGFRKWIRLESGSISGSISGSGWQSLNCGAVWRHVDHGASV